MKRTSIAMTIFLALLPANLPAADLLVDHVEYIRAAGTAQQMSLFFPGCDTQGTYTLTVKNGQDEAHRATAGSVSVNGVELVGAADFTQSPALAAITRTIGNVKDRNTIALSATAPQGSVIGWQVTAEVGCPDITIDDPPPGNVIDRSEITVSGRVRHRTPEVGVRVNRKLAQVNGNRWVVNGVALDAGENTLSVETIDENGLMSTTSDIVNRPESIPDEIKLEVAQANGIAPLDVTFSITNETGKAISLYAINFGDGTSTTVAEAVEVSHRYGSEGVFQVVASGTDADGAAHTDAVAVSVHAMPPLKTRWEKMKAGLALGDISQALANFTEQEARVQEQTFQTLGPQAATVVQQMQDIERVFIEGDRAQFRIRRNELVDGVEKPITYYIEFIRNDHGLWKIDSF